jgi:hypothetical protein
MNFLYSFSKKSQISNFTKIHSVETELFRADRQAYMKLVVAFRNFAKALQKELINCIVFSPKCIGK